MTMKTVLSLMLALMANTVTGENYTEDKGYSDSSSVNSYNGYGGSSNAYGTNFFADSSNTYYDGYQQAWRYLGWYVSCGNPSDRYEASQEHSHDSNENRVMGNMWCQRYLMWAAYVDEGYQGGGIGEYSFYDTDSGEWDESACDSHGNGRCAPMDCHEMNSDTWKLIGVFKEASYFGNDAFFEQLFKHEGVCVWNDEDLYDFMSESREGSWSEGCVQTGNLNDAKSDYLYIDLKPTYNGNMTYALYTDNVCRKEYDGTQSSVDWVAKNMGLLYGEYLEKWNDALEIYKVCQPCRAYNLQYSSSSKSSNNNNRYSKYSNGKYNYYSKYGNGRALGNDDDPNDGYFQCDDDADYTNVNQCMKFRTHAELEVATWEDLAAATNQGGILQINISNTIFGSDRISREEEAYVENIRKQQVAKAKAEAIAQREAVREAQLNKSEAMKFMVGGAVTLGFAALFAFKLVIGSFSGSSGDGMGEELLANEKMVAA